MFGSNPCPICSRPDLEVVEMVASPAHGRLNCIMELAKVIGRRDLNPTPNWRLGVLQRHLELEDLLIYRQNRAGRRRGCRRCHNPVSKIMGIVMYYVLR